MVLTPAAKQRLKNLTMQRQNDWLDRDQFHRRFDSFSTLPASETEPLQWPAWMILGVDLWLDDLIGRTRRCG